VTATLAGCFGAGLVLMLLLWLWQQRTRDASAVDAGWTVMVAGFAVALAAGEDGAPARRVLVAVLAGAWGLRLAFHLVRDRVLAAKGEDGRYRALRQRWGARAPWNFLLLHLAQVGFALLFAVPLLAAMRGGPLDGWAAGGAAVWVVAVAGEAVADRQLATFRRAPAHLGQVCREGLWRYSRHPNYFFEWLHWWAYVLIGRLAPLTFVGPAAMLLFLFRLTGIPYTERQALASRGEAYRDYQRTTSAFVPWLPRRGAGRGSGKETTS